MKPEELFDVQGGAAVRGEAVTLTDEQVAERCFGIHPDDFLDDDKDVDYLKYDGAVVRQFLSAPVSPRAADAPSEPSESAKPPAGLDTREQMIWLMGRNSFEGSATATRLDILSLVHSLMHNAYTAGMEGEEIDTSYVARIENGLRAMESRAADALDSQPTDLDALRRIARELRTYSPAGDAYHGAHIHKVWAGEIEKALATQPTVAAQQGSIADDARTAVRDAVADNLRGLYYCGRVWSAWSVGTMGEDDFSPAEEDDDIISNITDAVLAALDSRASSAPVAPIAPDHNKHFTPMQVHGTVVYLGRSGGFDVRDCPDAADLAQFIVASCNAAAGVSPALQQEGSEAGNGSDLKAVHDFLMGESALEGVQFGERHPTKAGAFWWRLNLRAALAKG